jgi:hypothetical protein
MRTIIDIPILPPLDDAISATERMVTPNRPEYRTSQEHKALPGRQASAAGLAFICTPSGAPMAKESFGK